MSCFNMCLASGQSRHHIQKKQIIFLFETMKGLRWKISSIKTKKNKKTNIN